MVISKRFRYNSQNMYTLQKNRTTRRDGPTVRNVIMYNPNPSWARLLFAFIGRWVLLLLLLLLLLLRRRRGVRERLRRRQPNISKVFIKRRNLLPRSPKIHPRVQMCPE